MFEATALRDLLLEDLAELKPYVYYEAKTGSIYIKFEDKRIGSLRIGDHQGRQKYRYRWNLWVGSMDLAYAENDRGVRRWHYSAVDVDRMVEHIYNYAHAIWRRDGREDTERTDEPRWRLIVEMADDDMFRDWMGLGGDEN